jgi:hypothetical protein
MGLRSPSTARGQTPLMKHRKDTKTMRRIKATCIKCRNGFTYRPNSETEILQLCRKCASEQPHPKSKRLDDIPDNVLANMIKQSCYAHNTTFGTGQSDSTWLLTLVQNRFLHSEIGRSALL